DYFHQKRVPAHPDYVGEQFVRFPSGHSTVFAVIDNAAALAWVINLGCIELHTWHSRVDDIERPDYILIDLDPTTDDQWEDVLVIALVVKEVLDDLELPTYPKTSGSTGLHVLTPIRPELPFPEVRRFAKAVAQEVERRIADQRVATTTWKVADRKGVFVDYGQNARDRTIGGANRPSNSLSLRKPGPEQTRLGRKCRHLRRRRFRVPCNSLLLALRAEQRRHGQVVGAPGGSDLAPGAVLRILVRPPADEARAVPEAVLLQLVVAH